MKPVAWRVWNRMGGISLTFKKPDASEYVEYDSLYTAPRELSDDEIIDIADTYDWHKDFAIDFARAILQKASEE